MKIISINREMPSMYVQGSVQLFRLPKVFEKLASYSAVVRPSVMTVNRMQLLPMNVFPSHFQECIIES